MSQKQLLINEDKTSNWTAGKFKPVPIHTVEWNDAATMWRYTNICTETSFNIIRAHLNRRSYEVRTNSNFGLWNILYKYSGQTFSFCSIHNNLMWTQRRDGRLIGKYSLMEIVELIEELQPGYTPPAPVKQ